MTDQDQPAQNLSPTEKAAAVKEAFEAKVLILEQWAKDGLPDNVDLDAKDFPKHRAKLRRWTGPNHDLREWIDPKIDQPITGKYADLTKRFEQAIKTIQDRSSAKGNRLKEISQELAYLRQKTENLEIQNATLMGDNKRLKDHNDRLLSQIKAIGKYPVA
nr:hypothetical protein [uncultured Cohaesibacter sp.]